jgi:signal transduction histidine kinase
VVIDFLANSHNLSLRIADNGRGFDPLSQSAGHGLVNMQRRAEKLNGSFEMESLAGQGTTVKIVIPLSRAGRGG